MIKSDKGIDRQKVREGSGKSGGEGREREGSGGGRGGGETTDLLLSKMLYVVLST